MSGFDWNLFHSQKSERRVLTETGAPLRRTLFQRDSNPKYRQSLDHEDFECDSTNEESCDLLQPKPKSKTKPTELVQSVVGEQIEGRPSLLSRTYEFVSSNVQHCSNKLKSLSKRRAQEDVEMRDETAPQFTEKTEQVMIERVPAKPNEDDLVNKVKSIMN